MSSNLYGLKLLSAMMFVLIVSELIDRRCVAADVLGEIRIVALKGDSFPGVPSDVRIEQFGFPRVDSLGRAAFKARLLQRVGDTVATNDTAIWTEIAPNDLRFVAREGGPVLDLNYTFNEVEPGENLLMSGGGSTYFIAGISNTVGPPNGSSGIFRFSAAAGLEFLAASSPIGAVIPTAGGPGVYFSNFLDFNESGDIAMQTEHGFGEILALQSGGELSTVTPTGSFPKINDNGDVVHRETGPEFVDNIVVWNHSALSSRIVASENEIAPGAGGAQFRALAGGGTFNNSDGVVTFTGQLLGAGVNESNDFGIWSETSPGGAVKLDMREGQLAAGVGAGVVWSGFNQFSVPVTFGRSGGVALRLNLAGAGVVSTNDSGVWAGANASDLHLVAREGDQAQGTEAGTFFSQFDQAGVTADGRGVFFAHLTGDALDPNRAHGIWAEGPDGLLQLIARAGDLVELPGGELSPLASVQFGPEFGVGEKGHIAFIGGFVSNEFGVFVSSAVAVPEPGALLVAQTVVVVFGCFIVAPRRRRNVEHDCRHAISV
jgi:hypothetical protein